jgi:predicted dehydrogenase
VTDATTLDAGARGARAGAPPGARRPRLGFLGTGWIGRHRMEAIARDGRAAVAAVSDPSPEAAAAAADAAQRAQGAPVPVVDSLDALLDLAPDGVVIATPSALHAEQAVRALERGAAVFCQKPLARDAAETRRVVDAARAADRLLGVDLSYRHTAGMRAVRDLVARGSSGACTPWTSPSTTRTAPTSRGSTTPRSPAAAA